MVLGCCFDCFLCILGRDALFSDCVLRLGYLLLCSFDLVLVVTLFVRFWFCGLIVGLVCLFLLVCMFVSLLGWFVFG